MRHKWLFVLLLIALAALHLEGCANQITGNEGDDTRHSSERMEDIRLKRAECVVPDVWDARLEACRPHLGVWVL